MKKTLYFILYNLVALLSYKILPKLSFVKEGIVKYDANYFQIVIYLLVTFVVLGYVLFKFLKEYEKGTSKILFYILLIFVIITIIVSMNISPVMLALMNRNIKYISSLYLLLGSIIAVDLKKGVKVCVIK